MTTPVVSQLTNPDDRLTSVFGHFYSIQQPPNTPRVEQRLLPNYEMLLVFNFGPSVSASLGDDAFVMKRTTILGPLRKLLWYELPPGANLIVVVFTLDGFHRLLGKSLRHLTLSDWAHPDVLLNPNSVDELWQQLAEFPTLNERLQHINTYALNHLLPITDATRSLLDSIPQVEELAVDPVKAMAESDQVSTRSIQNRLQTHLGYSAKELLRFLRFKRVFGFLVKQSSVSVDWLELVQTFGYHDQSHLIKDFRYYLGLTPRQFMKQLVQGDVCISKRGKLY